jgi:hypothetical protein
VVMKDVTHISPIPWTEFEPANSGPHDASGGTFNLLQPQWSTSKGLTSPNCLRTLQTMRGKCINSHMGNSQHAKWYSFCYKTTINDIYDLNYLTSKEEISVVLLYRVIQNDFRGFNNLAYTIHLR